MPNIADPRVSDFESTSPGQIIPCFLQTATFLKFCNLGNFREEGVQQKLQKMWLPLNALLRDFGMKSP